MKGIVVHSDKRHKPQYWVTVKTKTVFESSNGSEAIQWAIDNYGGPVSLDGSFELKDKEQIRGKDSLIWQPKFVKKRRGRAYAGTSRTA